MACGRPCEANVSRLYHPLLECDVLGSNRNLLDCRHQSSLRMVVIRSPMKPLHAQHVEAPRSTCSWITDPTCPHACLVPVLSV